MENELVKIVQKSCLSAPSLEITETCIVMFNNQSNHVTI